ncbi:HAD hydrolase-like protein [Candidatus Daviesbacteria bacterium]|nr:HAD hydrolase-like protein [Candidatus Daviesbacteria bacterium]MBI4035332.1 HAD hydrolase-like protein [Candidatus Daviesbacteria bacterium]
MIKAIIFDAGGLLYKRGDAIEALKKDLLVQFGYQGNYKDFEKAYIKEKFSGYIQQKSVEEMFKDILSTIGLKLDSYQLLEFIHQFNTIHKKIAPSEYAISTLSKLKEMGLKICILTDSFYNEEEKWNWFKRIGMNHLIDIIVTSFDIKKLKDSKEAYEQCLDKLQLKPEEVIFVGHQQYEMDGAKEAKIISIAIASISEPNIKADFIVNSLKEVPGFISNL